MSSDDDDLIIIKTVKPTTNEIKERDLKATIESRLKPLHSAEMSFDTQYAKYYKVNQFVFSNSFFFNGSVSILPIGMKFKFTERYSFLFHTTKSVNDRIDIFMEKLS
ncbi:hypothetical protein A3Q56_08374, partial [Intoshia linei]